MYVNALQQLHISVHYVQMRHTVDLEIHQQPLPEIKLVEGCRRFLQPRFHLCRADVAVQVENKIELLAAQLGHHLGHIFFDRVNPGDVGIVLENAPECAFGEVMNFCIGHLLLKATYNRRRQHDIADRAEPYDEKFFQNGKAYFSE